MFVFVEAETRSNEDRSMSEDVIADDKRTICEMIAIDYLASADVSEVAVRFDVVSIRCT